MLTGQIRKPEDIPEGDQRRHYDRFQPGNFENNLKLVDRLAEIASKKGCTTTQLALAWLLQQGVLPIPGSTRVEGVKEALGAADVKLSEAESKEIRQAVDSADIKGGRYMRESASCSEADRANRKLNPNVLGISSCPGASSRGLSVEPALRSREFVIQSVVLKHASSPVPWVSDHFLAKNELRDTRRPQCNPFGRLPVDRVDLSLPARSLACPSV